MPPDSTTVDGEPADPLRLSRQTTQPADLLTVSRQTGKLCS